MSGLRSTRGLAGYRGSSAAAGGRVYQTNGEPRVGAKASRTKMSKGNIGLANNVASGGTRFTAKKRRADAGGEPVAARRAGGRAAAPAGRTAVASRANIHVSPRPAYSKWVRPGPRVQNDQPRLSRRVCESVLGPSRRPMSVPTPIFCRGAAVEGGSRPRRGVPRGYSERGRTPVASTRDRQEERTTYQHNGQEAGTVRR